MRAIVLSGGGNLGPAQVGALRALMEHDVQPDMIVGCSAGALNASFLAREMSMPQLDALSELWRDVTRGDVYPGNRFGAFWRFLRGKDSFYDNRRFCAFLQRHGTTPALTFGDHRPIQLFVTATNLLSGELHVFGDNPSDRVLDALMSSTALTPLHPPWEVAGERFIDGGTVTPLPLRVALERGAKEIFALHIVGNEPETPGGKLIQGVISVLTSSVNTMLRLQAQHDLLLADVARRVKLHYIPLRIDNPPESLDFGQTDRLIEAGYTAAQRYFQSLGLSGEVEQIPVWQRVTGWFGRKKVESDTEVQEEPLSIESPPDQAA